MAVGVFSTKESKCILGLTVHVICLLIGLKGWRVQFKAKSCVCGHGSHWCVRAHILCTWIPELTEIFNVRV